MCGSGSPLALDSALKWVVGSFGDIPISPKRKRGNKLFPRLRFLKLRFSGIAKRWQHVAVGVSPREQGKNESEPRSGDSAFRATNSCRRFAAHHSFLLHFLRAYARSYVRPPLRG
jgi:hypothetical protein